MALKQTLKGLASSRTDALLPKNVSRMCSTEAGAQYVTRALHPPGDVTTLGVPDGAEGQTVVVDQRMSFVLTPPSGLLADPDTEMSVLIFCPPGNNCMAIVAYGRSNADFRTASMAAQLPLIEGQVYVEAYYYEQNALDGFLPCQMCCYGNEAEPPPVATAGEIAAWHKATRNLGPGVLRPMHSRVSADAPLVDDEPPQHRLFSTSINSSQFLSFRTIASSVTCYFSAPQLQNQGFVHCYNGASRPRATHPIETRTVGSIVAAAIQPFSTPGQVSPFVQTDPLGTLSTVYDAVIPYVMRLPFDEDEMTKMRADPYVRRATEGFYSIHRPLGFEQNFVERSTQYATVDVLSSSPINWARFEPRESSRSFVGGNTTRGFAPIPLPGVPWNMVRAAYGEQYPWGGGGFMTTPPGTTVVPWLQDYYQNSSVPIIVQERPNQNLSDLGYDDWTSTVAIYRAISIQASLEVKRVLTLEARVVPTSPLVAMLKRPPLADLRAVNALRVLARVAPNVYPAKDNSWATILSTISKVAGTIGAGLGLVSTVVPELAPFAMVAEGVGGAARVIEQVIPRPKGPSPAVVRVEAPKPTKRVVVQEKSSARKKKVVVARRKR